MALWQHGDATVSELARHLGLPAHCLDALAAATGARWTDQAPSQPLDSRALLIELTLDGGGLETSAAAVQRTVECSTGLSSNALAALRGELHNLVDDLGATAAHSDPLEGRAP